MLLSGRLQQDDRVFAFGPMSKDGERLQRINVNREGTT